MPKLDYILRRMLKAIVIVFCIAVLNFALIRLAPGDPATVIAGEAGAGDAAFVQQLREQFGLDRPLHEQLFRYIKGLTSFDLGVSYRQKEDVTTLILERLPATLLLAGVAFSLAVGLGITLGAVAAMRAGRWADTAITVLALGFYATPLFWAGLMASLLFSVHLGWLPAFGMESIGAGYDGVRRALDIAHHLILPATTLGLFYMAVYARLTRASMLEVTQMDYVRTARAKGLRQGRITRQHVLRNAILPVITFAGLNAGHLVGGSVLVETVFAWPGLGRLTFDALMQRDYNLLLGVLLVMSTIVVAFNLATDLIYSVVDPRIELAK
ncbi:MAG TPA: ABC transporter permease [Alphaproteobacteria bacterium]|nr:ABC transporter permease [Alphaproteobacteria bacterium]